MVKKKEKKKGWDYSVRWESEDKRKEVVEHRKKKEEEGLSVLLKDLSPHLDGYDLKLGWCNGKCHLCISLENGGSAEVVFRYPFRGFEGRGACEGLKVSAHGNPNLGRNYGFDFDAMRVAPATLEKMARAIREHLESNHSHLIHIENQRKKTKANVEKVVSVLQAAGHEAEVRIIDETRAHLNIDGSLALYVRASGAILSVGSMESVPIHATSANIVEVVKAIEQLRAVMDH